MGWLLLLDLWQGCDRAVTRLGSHLKAWLGKDLRLCSRFCWRVSVLTGCSLTKGLCSLPRGPPHTAGCFIKATK